MGIKSIKNNFLIVGIGASAGGIQALQALFQHVSTDSGIAYVVILHLSPNHDSHLTEVLQTASLIPVTQVTDPVAVEPNHIYVVSPNQRLLMNDGVIAVALNTTLEDRRTPLDIFFRTLAESHHHLAASVILSGTGANGSIGLKRVKELGGVVFVQNPREAEFNEMPRNAIATHLVDDILPVVEIPAKLIAYMKRFSASEFNMAPEQQQEVEQQLREARDLLEKRVEERTAKLRATHEVRRELLRKLVAAQEEERTRIVRELHDHTGQYLTMTAFSLSALQKLALPEPAQTILNELATHTRALNTDIHNLIQGIRTPLLDSFGLDSALEDSAQKWSTWSNIPARVEYLKNTQTRPPTEVETTIYRIVQEALTNVMRHAKGANLVTISVVQNPDKVTAVVKDNGPGFDVAKLDMMPIETRRLGIVGMQERAKLMGGDLTIESEIGRGTTLTVWMPSSPREHDEAG